MVLAVQLPLYIPEGLMRGAVLTGQLRQSMPHLLQHLGCILVSLRQRGQQPRILCLQPAAVAAAACSVQRVRSPSTKKAEPLNYRCPLGTGPNPSCWQSMPRCQTRPLFLCPGCTHTCASSYASPTLSISAM